jgi:hypothetical protein
MLRPALIPFSATGARRSADARSGHKPVERRPRHRGHGNLDAQTISMARRPTSIEMRKPMPTIGEPKNSATMAPISARVVQIFKPVEDERASPWAGAASGASASSSPHRCASGRAASVSDAFSPCTQLTSIGKKTIATTTAAFDCQPKPNHITRIGAVPTMGRAAMKLPTGSRPLCRKGERSMAMAVRNAAPQPMIARQRALHEGLHEIGPEDVERAREFGRDGRGRGQDHARHVEGRAPALPRPPAPRGRRSDGTAMPPPAGGAPRARIGDPDRIERPGRAQKASAPAIPSLHPAPHCRQIPHVPGQRSHRELLQSPTIARPARGEDRRGEQRRPDLDRLAVIGPRSAAARPARTAPVGSSPTMAPTRLAAIAYLQRGEEDTAARPAGAASRTSAAPLAE